jgi:hypothetical protein
LRLHPSKVGQELFVAPGGGSDAVAIRALLRGAAKRKGKPRCGDKDPLCTMYLGRIFADFVDPRVIYVTRDPRPTILSLSRMPWAPSGVLTNSLFCRFQFEQVRPYLDKVLEVRLEDLAAAPRAVLESVLRFVGEPWDEAVLDHVGRAGRDDVAPLPWFSVAKDEPGTVEAVDRDWRTRLSPADVSVIEGLTRPILKRYGYLPASFAADMGLSHTKT